MMRGSRSLLLRCFAPMMVLSLSIACLAVQGGAALAAPGTPVLLEPGYGRVDVVSNPMLEASAYTGSPAHKATEWQLDDWHDQDLWTNPEWSRTSVAAETGTVVNAANGTFANALAGRTSLDPNETYFWRVRYQDSADNWSGWSEYWIFVTATSTWYLAEGSTDGGMETWVLVQNPGDVNAVVAVEFMTDGGAVRPAELQKLTIAPNSRISLNAGSYVTSFNVSTRVAASAGTIVCERAVYGNGRQWGHDSIGATTPSSTWYLAEGCTGGDFETWVLVQNPGSGEVSVDLNFMTSSGNVPGPQGYSIPADSRVSFKVNDYVTDYNVSTRVTSTGGVICERAVYGNGKQWGHDSIGATSPESGWCFAEGCTLGGMETWILVQNPMNYVQDVIIIPMGDNIPANTYIELSLPAYSRVSTDLGLYVDSYDVSTTVLTWDMAAGRVKADGKIVCERAMYDTTKTWGHDSVGSPYIYPYWVLPEGSTGGGMETWILVQNPTQYDGVFDMIFMTEAGIVFGPQDVAIAAFSRISVNVADYVGTYNVSTLIDSDVQLVCERSMYGSGKTWAHNSVGYMLGIGNIGGASAAAVGAAVGSGLENRILSQKLEKRGTDDQ